MTRVWYHGDLEPRAHFLDQRWQRPRDTDPNAHGPGLYFASTIGEAAQYGPFIYEATLSPYFRGLPDNLPPNVNKLRRFYAYAPHKYQVAFLNDWDVTSSTQALKRYVAERTMYEALLGLYPDLYRRDADAWVSSLVKLGYDGYIHDARQILVAWNPRKMTIHRRR